jgi:uncharacterized protein (DUF1501 family)
MTDIEQRLRNETGRLTRALQDASQQRKEMQADLIWQRDDITEAIELLQAGSVRDAIQVLQGSLDRRNRTREQRRVKSQDAE